MKKIIIGAFAACGLLFTASGRVQAQTSIRFGLKAGGSLNFSKINFDNLSYNGDSRFGFYGGGLAEISPNAPENKLKIQLEALYSRINIRYSFPGNAVAAEKLGVNQINVPLLAKYFILPELSVNLGPTFNFNLNGKGTLEDTAGVSVEEDLTDFNTFQMGLAAGATYYIYKGFFVEARYTPIFGTLNKSIEGYEGVGMKMSAVKFGIGYKF